MADMTEQTISLPVGTILRLIAAHNGSTFYAELCISGLLRPMPDSFNEIEDRPFVDCSFWTGQLVGTGYQLPLPISFKVLTP